MSSAISFNLDQSKILSSGNGLSHAPLKLVELFTKQDNTTCRLVQFEGIADDTINANQKLKLVLGRVENILGKGKNAGYQHFLLFP